MTRLLSQTFRTIKSSNLKSSKTSSSQPPSSPDLTTSKSPPSTSKHSQLTSRSRTRPWCVYLILSTNPPIKTYVGVTNNFSRRLKQHNGELKGGAKASRAGRPWICACLICGFSNQSEACGFESKWKSLSKKLPGKKKNDDMKNQSDDSSHLLLQHRQIALNRTKYSFDCSRLEINWQLNPF